MGNMAILRLPWVKKPGPHTVFVLGGGGNLGAIQVGMLQAVMERGILPDAVVGCSVGAINAAGLAVDPTLDGVDRLREIWLGVQSEVIGQTSRFSSIKLLTNRGPALHTNDGLRSLLERCLPHERFEDFAIPFHVVAASLRTGRAKWFSEGPYIEPILASAALPAILPPVVIDGEPFIDGAVVDNVPISRALELGAERVVVFHVGNFDRPRPMPKRPIDVLVQAFSIARNFRFQHEISAPVPEGVEMLVLPGVDPGKVRYDDFTRSRELIERGHAAAIAHLDASLREAAST